MKLQRRFKDIGIEGRNARWYDNNTRRHRLGEMKEYAKEVAKQVHDGSLVLEVAPGPGYLAIELAKLGNYKIIGLDISKKFVEIARRNAKNRKLKSSFDRVVLQIFHFQIIHLISLSALLRLKILKILSQR